MGGTCDEGWHAPAQHIVEAHGASVDIAHFGECPVQVQGLQQGPGEGAEVQEVQQDGNDCASKLGARPCPVSDQGMPRVCIPSCQTEGEGLGVGWCFRKCGPEEGTPMVRGVGGGAGEEETMGWVLG